MERFQALSSVFSRLFADAKARAALVALAACGAPALGIAVFGDPSSAYAVARVRLPELAPPSALAGQHAEESHTAYGMRTPGQRRIEPRDFLRAAPSEHVESATHAAPYPVEVPGENRGGDPVLAPGDREAVLRLGHLALHPRLADLDAGAEHQEPFALLTGETGTGKTALLRELRRTHSQQTLAVPQKSSRRVCALRPRNSLKVDSTKSISASAHWTDSS